MKLIKTVNIIILLCVNIFVSNAQFDYLKVLNVDQEQLSENLIIVGNSNSYEGTINHLLFNKARITPVLAHLSFIDLYIEEPNSENALELMNLLYEKLGKDDDGNQRINENSITNFKTSPSFGSTWYDKKNHLHLSVSYSDTTSFTQHYPGIMVTFSSNFVPIEEDKYETSINPREILKSIKEPTFRKTKWGMNKLEIDIDDALFYRSILKSIKEPTFRKTKWGMNKLEIIELEGEPSDNIDDALFYRSKLVAGIKAEIIFVFVDDALVRTKYIFNEVHSNSNDYISDYTTVKDVLVQKYGDPYTDQTNWNKDLYRDDVQNYGMAISVGHLVLKAGWLNIDSDILISLSGDNFEISHIVQYSSNALSMSLEKTKKKKLLDQF